MKLGLCSFAGLAVVSLSQFAHAGVVVGQVDTFQDGTTDAWFAGGLGLGLVPPIPPQVVANGGPRGAGDQFLQITGIGGAGAGSRIVAFNLAQWPGDYSNFAGIGMDLKNLGSTPLTTRLQFDDPMPGPPVDEAVTTFGVSLPVGGGWTHAFFAILPSAMTVVTGDVNTLLHNTTLLRIIVGPTPTEAISIVRVLGVDNINAVPEPATFLPALGALAWLVRRRSRRTGR